jgi:Tol biopolymer transport system component
MRHLYVFIVLLICVVFSVSCNPIKPKYGGGVIVAAFEDGKGNEELLLNHIVSGEYHSVSLPRHILGLSVSLTGQIVYSSGSSLYFFDENKGETKLISVKGDLVYPVWSPDGRYIALSSVLEKAYLNVFNMKQDVITNLTGNSSYEDDSKDWVDNSHILILSASPSGMNQLSTIQVDGSDRKILYEFPYYYSITRVQLSPDKNTLVLDATDFSKSNQSDFIELFSMIGKTEKVLKDIPIGSTSPVWSPDGKYIAYCYDKGIFIYELETGIVTQLSIPEAVYSDLVWSNTVK